MTLYEIDSSIRDILEKLEPDETGLLPENCDELFEQLQNLDMQRQQKLENVARWILNLRSETAALKIEENRLSARRKTLEKKESCLMDFLDRACAGQKTDLGVATLSYRRNEHVEVIDPVAAVKFLQEGHADCIRTYDPEISKKEVKELIRSGTAVPGVEIAAGISCSLR